MARETRVQSQVESYQRLKKWYLIPPCLTLSIIRYVLRVKWSNPGKGVAPSSTPRSSSYWKGGFWVAPDYGRQLYLYNCANWFIILNHLYTKLKTNVFSSSCSYISTTVWLHYLNSNKTLREKVRWELHKGMLRAVLNISWVQHPTKKHLWGHLPPISQNIQERRTKHTKHSWKSKYELISNVTRWTPTYGHTSFGRSAKIYIHQLRVHTGCHLEDLSRSMDDGD